MDETEHNGQKLTCLCHLSSKIFPPTPEDLPSEEEDTAEASTTPSKPSTSEASAAINDPTAEPQTKKLKTSTSELGNDDWEAIEKPTNEATATSDNAAAGMSEEEVEKDKVEKFVGKGEGDGTAKAGSAGLENNMLAKDW